MGCSFIFGLIMGGVALLGALTAGFPSWVIQQAVMMLIALNLVPAARKVAVLRTISHDVDRLMTLYEANPKYTSAFYTLFRLMPMINWFIFWREIRVMLVIAITGIPLDIFLEAVETYVLNLPNWGQAAKMNFAGRIGMSAMYTIMYTPYLMLIVLGIRKALGIKMRRAAKRVAVEDEDDEDERPRPRRRPARRNPDEDDEEEEARPRRTRRAARDDDDDDDVHPSRFQWPKGR